MERYDGEGWEEVAPLPRATSNYAAAVVGDHVHVVGGVRRYAVDAEHAEPAFVRVDLSHSSQAQIEH
mgnify:CR=1 FL=1